VSRPGISAHTRRLAHPSRTEEDAMELRETSLPGVGLRHDFTTSGGRQLGVVSHLTGRRDLVVYNRRDPDAAQEVVQLTAEESDTLAELLGSARVLVSQRLAALQQVKGLAIDWLPIQAGSPYAGGTIADTQGADPHRRVDRGRPPQWHRHPRPPARPPLPGGRHPGGGRHHRRHQGPLPAAWDLVPLQATFALLGKAA
jgi:hypothetical protein